MKTTGLVVVVGCAVVGPAHAEVKGEPAERSVLAGVVVRTDRSTQSTRVSAGVQTGRAVWSVVIDPLGYQRAGQQSDTDVGVQIAVTDRWGMDLGWRLATIPILGRRYWHHKPLIGVSAPLPTLLWGHLRPRVGAELAITAIRHGDELPTMAIWDTRTWDGTDDAIDVALYLRAELARGF